MEQHTQQSQQPSRQPMQVTIVGAGNMGRGIGTRLVEGGHAVTPVARLITDGGLRVIDAGPLARSRELEALGLLGITLQGSLGTQYTTGWKLVA